jgi:hypothetical protein
MTAKTVSVALGRARLPKALAAQLLALPPGLRGRTMAVIVQAHVSGLDLEKLIAAADQLRRLGVLINQALRSNSPDHAALSEAAKKVNALWP